LAGTLGKSLMSALPNHRAFRRIWSLNVGFPKTFPTEAFFCTNLQATPAQILQWVIMRWSVEVTLRNPGTFGTGNSTAVVGPRYCPHHPGPGGPVLTHHRVGPTAEPRWADPSGDDGMVSQSRADLYRLSNIGTSASLARSVFGELCYRARVRAISPGGFRTLAHWPSVSSLIGQSRVQ
jgi:hypothetical protein